MMKLSLIHGFFKGNVNGVQALYFNFHLFQPLQSSISLLYSTSTTNKGNNNNDDKNPSCSSSLFLNYLVNSLGFSTPKSLSIYSVFFNKRKSNPNERRLSDYQIIETATCVVHFFKQHGFQDSHIRKLVACEPRILVSRVDKTLKPKFKLLSDLGFSRSQLVFSVLRNPLILRHKLVPVLHAFRTVLGSDPNVVIVLRKANWLNFSNVAKYMIPNVELLKKSYDIDSDKIHKFILRSPRVFSVSPDVFQDRLMKVEHNFGIPRDSTMFLYGLHLVSSLSEKCFEGKCRIFESFGWTQSDVIGLIRRNPMCLALSEARISENLDFLMKQLGYDPKYLVSRSGLLIYSVKKRLIPRHRVLEVLKAKGLVRVDYTLFTAAGLNETTFLKKFVLPFEEVHRIYELEMGFKVGSLALEKAKGQPKVEFWFDSKKRKS